MPLSPAERSLRARKAAYTLHAKHDSHRIAARARAGLDERFLREVDPAGELPEAERQRRAAMARKAFFCDLALKSAKARRAARAVA